MRGHADHTAPIRQHYLDQADHVRARGLSAPKDTDHIDHAMGCDLSDVWNTSTACDINGAHALHLVKASEGRRESSHGMGAADAKKFLSAPNSMRS